MRTSSSWCSPARFAFNTATTWSKLKPARSSTPRGIGHSFHVDSHDTRLLLFFGPAGVEGFFREVGTPARSFIMPPADEPVPDRDTIIAIMSRHGQTVLGPPLPAKD